MCVSHLFLSFEAAFSFAVRNGKNHKITFRGWRHGFIENRETRYLETHRERERKRGRERERVEILRDRDIVRVSELVGVSCAMDVKQSVESDEEKTNVETAIVPFVS